MTNQTPESVIAEVIEYHADAIGSHYDGCYKRHAVCLAVKLRDMLREPGVPDVVTGRFECDRECIGEGAPVEDCSAHGRTQRDLWEQIDKVVAERDAATAALERVTAERDAAMARIAKAWELHEPFTWSFGYGPVQSCKWCADHGVSQEVASWPCPTVAAIEGAPELVQVDEAALIREAKAEALEEKGYFLKGHAEWTRSNFLPGPHSDACAKYNDEIGDELIEDAAELRARAAEYREGSET